MKKWNVYAAAVLAAVGILGGCGAKNAEARHRQKRRLQSRVHRKAAWKKAGRPVQRSQKQRQRKMEPCLLPM